MKTSFQGDAGLATGGARLEVTEKHGLDRLPSPSSTVADALRPEAQECARLGIDQQHFEAALFAGAREFLSRPGKGFRARLAEASFGLIGRSASPVPRAVPDAIELLHAGSLIVDDIQDDADERRGGPTLHRTLGMPRALNTGNWLYFVALSKLDELAFDPSRALHTARAAHRCLLRCHEGQALDLSTRIAELKRADVAGVARTTSELKTGALMSFAARLGAVAAGAEPAEEEILADFGERVGVVLQMLDDLSSFVSEARKDKALEDLRGQRVSWVWAFGVERLDPVTYKQLTRQTARHENLFEVRQRLAQAVEPLGRQRIRDALRLALSELERTFGERPTFPSLHADLSRLEQSYG